MKKIVIIAASVREGRKSDRVALYFRDLLARKADISCEIADLMDYNFPVFNERLKFQKSPAPRVLEFAEKIRSADGVIIVTPEYNGGYPASLKNVTDLLYDEWKRKPLALVSVSGGPFGGAQVLTSLLFTMWKIGAWMVPAMFPVPKVEEAFDAEGKPADELVTGKRAETFINELLLMMEGAAAIR